MTTRPGAGDVLHLVLVSLRAHVKFGPEPPAQMRAWRYRSFSELLLDVGRLFDPPPADRELVPDTWRGAPGTCFVSAALWSMSTGLPYVEGRAVAASDPASWMGTEHAWCTNGRGWALDPIWRPGWGVAYLGVPVSADYRRRVEHPELLTWDHDAGRTLLRDGIPDAARID